MQRKLPDPHIGGIQIQRGNRVVLCFNDRVVDECVVDSNDAAYPFGQKLLARCAAPAGAGEGSSAVPGSPGIIESYAASGSLKRLLLRANPVA